MDGIFFHYNLLIYLSGNVIKFSYISLAPWQPNWITGRRRRNGELEVLGAAVVPSLAKTHSASASVALRQLAWQTCQVAVNLALKHTV